MNFLKRNKRSVYVCESYDQDDVTIFRAPKELKVNFEPLSTAETLEGFGLEYRDFLKIKCDSEYSNLFKTGNKCYVHVKPPKVVDELCKECDYVVYSEPSIFLDSIEVLLKRLL